MNKAQALYSFFSGFGIPAYDATTVPDNAEFPYITYTTQLDSLGTVLSLSVNLWFRDTSWVGVTELAETIAKSIVKMQCVKLDNGFLYLAKGTPFAQRMADDSDDMVRRVYLNIQVEFLTEY